MQQGACSRNRLDVGCRHGAAAGAVAARSPAVPREHAAALCSAWCAGATLQRLAGSQRVASEWRLHPVQLGRCEHVQGGCCDQPTSFGRPSAQPLVPPGWPASAAVCISQAPDQGSEPLCASLTSPTALGWLNRRAVNKTAAQRPAPARPAPLWAHMVSSGGASNGAGAPKGAAPAAAAAGGGAVGAWRLRRARRGPAPLACCPLFQPWMP